MARIEQASFMDRMMYQIQKPGAKNKTIFFRLLAVSQKAWLGIREALQSILQSEQHYGMKVVIRDLIEDINQWFPFAKAMESHKGFFGWDEIELIRASEWIGNMPDTLNNIAMELENFQKIKGKVKGALTYPVMLLTFAILAVVVLLVKVIPTFVWLFAGRELPAITQYMLAASDYLQANWHIIFGIIIGTIVTIQTLYKYFLPFKILIDTLYLKVPVLKDVVKTFYLYRFSKLLADFYKSWVNPVVALEQMSAIFSNYLYKKKALDIRVDLEAWFGFADSMEWSMLFDPILVQIVLVWERTGNIDEVLLKMASFYDGSLENQIKTLMSLIEPLLMAFIAVIIWWIVASIFLPMADLVNAIT
jgi:type IV pilus assembly protein PilC